MHVAAAVDGREHAERERDRRAQAGPQRGERPRRRARSRPARSPRRARAGSAGRRRRGAGRRRRTRGASATTAAPLNTSASVAGGAGAELGEHARQRPVMRRGPRSMEPAGVCPGTQVAAAAVRLAVPSATTRKRICTSPSAIASPSRSVAWRDALAVDVHAVEAAVVEQHDLAAAAGDHGVAAGDRAVLEHHVGADPAAEAQGALADGDDDDLAAVLDREVAAGGKLLGGQRGVAAHAVADARARRDDLRRGV